MEIIVSSFVINKEQFFHSAFLLSIVFHIQKKRKRKRNIHIITWYVYRQVSNVEKMKITTSITKEILICRKKNDRMSIESERKKFVKKSLN